MTAFFEMPISILIVYFSYVFLKKKDLTFLQKCTLFSFLLPVLLLLPTPLNISSFYLTTTDCGGNIGFLWDYIYIIELLSISLIAYLTYQTVKSTSDKMKKREALFFGIAMVVFMSLFFTSGFFGDVTNNYNINVIGPIAMVLFIAFLGYIIVKFKTFHVKVFGAQALVAALTALVFAILFIRKIENVKYVVIGTLILILILGFNLIRGVKREIKQREKIEKLAKDLQTANDRLKELDIQKTEFVSFATHQLRSPLASMRGNASLILEGDAGPVSNQVKDIVSTIATSAKTLVTVVEDYLNISRIELGTMKYNLVDMDFKDLLTEVMNEQKPNIDAKGLKYSVVFDSKEIYKIKADPDKFKQVVMNVIDNSIKYTPQGSIEISLINDSVKNLVRLKIKDTGVGIDPKIMSKLFQKFSRADHANEANIHGTGLGLFIAKEIMNAHGGKVWAESDGEGKGSQFYIELPEVK
jgi:signal transduction histidine kinase